MDIDIIGLKASHNIVDYIDQYVPLKKSGKDYFGCCPFHGEKTASFSVNESKQFYHCFGCGANGDIVRFIMDYENIEFLQACEKLGHNAALNPSKTIKNKQENFFRMRNLLALDLQPWHKDELLSVLGNCEKFGAEDNQVFIMGSAQVVLLTDMNKNPVSLAMIEGKGFNFRYYKKEFLHGSCVIFGEQKGTVYLCEDYFDAVRLHKVENKNTICFFEPLNLFYIWQELKRRNCEIKVICKSDEAKFHADNFGLIGE